MSAFDHGQAESLRLHALARRFPFDGGRLAGAIASTFERHSTTIDTELPVALAPRFHENDAHAEQWCAYLTRNALPGAPADLAVVGELLQVFLVPPWRALGEGCEFSRAWSPEGPWASDPPIEEQP